MLHPFVATRPLTTVRPPSLLLSIGVHAFLIYAAFAPRARVSWASGEVSRPRPLAIERIHYTAVGPLNEAAETKTVPPKAKVRARGQRAPQLALPRNMPAIDKIEVPGAPDLPADIDLRGGVDDSTVFTSVRLADAVKGLVDPSTAGHTGPYTVASVDKAVRPYENNPTPDYPSRLRNQGVEGAFVAQFVVDSTGKVDEKTMLFPPTADALFINSVRQALRRSRYYPAEVGGRRVMQLVEQRFVFVLRR